MKRLKRLCLPVALTVTSLLSASVSAQAPTTPGATSPQGQYVGGNITREYRATDLKTSYGILDIAMGEIWVITMPDDVVDVITSREGVLQFSQRGQRVVVGAQASTGSYPMLVMTADSVYFFQVRLSASRGGGVRNIIVRGDEPAALDQVIPGFPNNPAQPRSVTPLSPAAPVTPVALPAPVLTPAAVPVVTPPVAPPAPARVTVPVAAPLLRVPAPTAPAAAPAAVTPAPTALPAARAEVDFRAVTDGKRTVLYYRVKNTGVTTVSFDDRALQLQSPDRTLKSTGTRGVLLVTPGTTEYGEVHLTDVPQSLSAIWRGAALSGGADVQIVRSVRVEALGASAS
jgi:hypothetical protein